MDEILFFDINKSREDRKFDYNFIRQLTDECNVPITIGGGIKTEKDVEKLFRIGADKILINTQFYKY